MRVLLANDQQWLRSALRLLLEEEPNVEVVGEVDEASTLPATTQSLAPDLLLLDWELSGMKSNRLRQQLITTLRSIQPTLYIIMLSGNQEANRYWLVAGVDAFVSKGEPPDHLLAALHQAEQSTQHPYANSLPRGRTIWPSLI
jgi:DNA-binding NarL/FixJ family response regulator